MGKKSSPKAPDPSAVAAAQGAANKEAVDASAADTQINQVTPQGSITYSGTIGQPDRTVTTSLSPAEQQQLDQSNQVASTLGNKAIGLSNTIGNQPALNYDNANAVPTNYDQLRQDSTNQVYNGMTQNLQRDFGRSEDTLRAKLASQGLNANDEAFNRELNTFDESKNTALNNAASTAYQYGQGEANNALNQALTTRNQTIGEDTSLHNQPINELSAILQGTPALNAQNPAQTNTGQFTQAPVNVAGINDAAYQGQLSAANAQSQKAGGTTAAVGSLAAAAAAFF